MPRENEKQDEFIARCMSDEVMVREYGDVDQRRAVCQRLWEGEAGATLAQRVEHAAGSFEISRAGMDEQTGEYRVAGYMNTFGAMHSRRIIHPRGFLKWLANHRNAHLPMLGNHGEVGGTYATIGEWDTFEHHEGRGMFWAGRVGSGTQLADDARRLLDQKLLRQLSFGFVVRQGRWVSLKDADLDAHLRGAMEAAELDEAYAVLDWYPVEGSIVDVADDPGARIAAKLRDEISTLKQQLAGQHPNLTESAIEPLLNQIRAVIREAVGAALDEFAPRLEARLFETYEVIRVDPGAEYATDLLSPPADDEGLSSCAHGEPAAPEITEPASATGEQLRAALAQIEALRAAIERINAGA
jgi:phage head maturation protease